MLYNNIFYDLILPYGKSDTYENAQIIIENIKSQQDYETVLIRSIGYKSKIILKNVIGDPILEVWKTLIKNNKSIRFGQRSETIQQRLINSSLQTNDSEIFYIIYDLFDIKSTLPKYKNLSELLYLPGIYSNDFININTCIEYLTDMKNIRHFEDTIADMRTVYEIGGMISKNEATDQFIKKLFNQELCEEELSMIHSFCLEYYNFITEDLDLIIRDIKSIEEKPESKKYCYGFLIEYLGRTPSRWEVDMLWDHTCTW